MLISLPAMTSAEYWQHIRTQSKKVVVWGAVLTVGYLAWDYWLKPENERLADKYGVAKEMVYIAPKPHGCDFDDAPLGNKHCHYERIESAPKDSEGKVTAVYVQWDKVQE